MTSSRKKISDSKKQNLRKEQFKHIFNTLWMVNIGVKKSEMFDWRIAENDLFQIENALDFYCKLNVINK